MYDIKDFVDDIIYPNLDRRVLLAPLKPEDLGHAYRVACPICGRHKALISKEGRYIRCREEGGCGRVQGIWPFAQNSRGLSHTETLTYLTEMADQVLTHPGPYDFSTLFAAQRKAQLLEDFLTWCEARLEESPEGVAYLEQERGLDREAIRDVKLGFYPSQDAARAYLIERRYTEEAMEAAGLFTRGLGETHQVVVGYRDRIGRLTGFAGRVLGVPPDGMPKYIYSAGTDKTSPYNLHKVRDFMEVIAVEGIFDVLSLRARGIDNVMGLEDAHFTRAQARLLTTCGIRKVILGFDRDAHGQDATAAALDILLSHPGVRSSVIQLPEDYIQPDAFIEDEGEEAYWERIKSAAPGARWRAEYLLTRHDLTTDRGRDGALRDGMGIEESIRDPTDGSVFRERLAEVLGIPLQQLQVTLRTERDVQQRERLEQGYRDLLDTSRELLTGGRLADLRDHLQEGVYSLRSREMAGRIHYFNVDEFMARARTAPASEVVLGIDPLDRLVHARRGEVVVIGARGRHGKTSLAHNLFLSQIERQADAPTLYFGFEVPEHVVMARLATIWAHHHRDARHAYGTDVLPHFSGSDFPKPIFEAFNALGRYGLEKRFSFVYRPGSTVDQLISYVQRVAEERGTLNALFVDYLELVRTSTRSDEARRTAEVMSKLRQLAQELVVPIFVTSLVDGACAPDGVRAGGLVSKVDWSAELARRRPTMMDFPEARRLQTDAATVLALYNRERELDILSPGREGVAEQVALEAYVVANREGAGGVCTLQFDMKTGWISGK